MIDEIRIPRGASCASTFEMSAMKTIFGLHHTIVPAAVATTLAFFASVCLADLQSAMNQFGVIGDASYSGVAGHEFHRPIPALSGKSSAFVLQVGSISAGLGPSESPSERAIRHCIDGDPCNFAEVIDLAAWLEIGYAATGVLAAVTGDTNIVTAGLQLDDPMEAGTGAGRLATVAVVQPVALGPARAAASQDGITPVTALPKAATVPSTLTLALVVLLPGGGLFFVILTIRNRMVARSVQELLGYFYYRVDLARQQFVHDPKSIDEHVQKAFDTLHEEMRLLLQEKKIRLSRLKREILSFHPPEAPAATVWQPPSLSEMGYVIVAADKFLPEASILAIYKYSGEERRQDGTIADMYTILKEGSSQGFSHAFKAKVLSPYTRPLTAPNSAR